MLHRFSRTEMLIGEDGLNKLQQATVVVIGVGGVGSFTAEALARCGVGRLVLVDYDDICLTNINRQLHALSSTLGQAKVDVMAERIRQINPQVEIITHKVFYSDENAAEIIYPGLSYVVDAVDTVTAKLQIICRCKELNVPVISCMGAGNKLDPTRFEVVDIQKTSECPLAKVVRKELRKRGHSKGVKVVYSKELPLTPLALPHGDCSKKRQTPGSISFVPSVAGLIAASVVVRDLLE